MNDLSRSIACLLFVAATTFQTGCTTIVHGGPATSRDGVHYFLPKPILLVTPNADGTLTVTNKSVTDMNREYTVSAGSVFGKYTFEAKIQKGLLTELDMNADSTDIAKNVVDAAGAIEKARIAADKKAVDAAAAAVKAKEDSIKSATKFVLDNKRALARLQAKRNELLRQGFAETSDQVKAVDLEIVTAQQDLTFSEEDLAALVGATPDVSTPSNAHDAGKGLSVKNATSTHDNGRSSSTLRVDAAGPVVYTIDQFIDPRDNLPRVRLIQSNWNRTSGSLEKPHVEEGIQLRFATASTAKAAEAPAAATQFFIDGPSAIAPSEGTLLLTIKVTGPLDQVSGGDVQDAAGSSAGTAQLALQSTRDKIVVSLPPALKKGTYTLSFHYQSSKDTPSKDQHIEFAVTK